MNGQHALWISPASGVALRSCSSFQIANEFHTPDFIDRRAALLRLTWAGVLSFRSWNPSQRFVRGARSKILAKNFSMGFYAFRLGFSIFTA